MEFLNKDIFVSVFSDEISSDLDKQIEIVKLNGMDYLCLRHVDGINIGEYTLNSFSEKILPRLKKNNIKVSSIGSPVGKIFIDDEKSYREQINILEELCKIANSLDCKYIRIFSFYIKKGEHEKYRNSVIEKLKQFANIAEKYDVILIHENEKEIYGDTAYRCKEIIENVNSIYLKSAFDFGNFVQCNENTLEAYELLKEHIVYIHIKDANKDSQNVVCGSGEGNIKTILKDMIINRKYKGFLTLEPHLSQFDGIKNLEFGNVDEIIINNGILIGEQGYIIQYNALLEILKELGDKV